MFDTQHPRSYYVASSNRVLNYPRLMGQESADVCIIGAGYTGLSCALHLAERGYSVILVEARKVGWGASGRNGGQLGSGQRQDQATLEAMLGIDHARQLWELAEAAKSLVKERIARHRIDCDLKPGILYPVHKRRLLDGYRRHVDKLQTDYHYPHARIVEAAALRDQLGTRAYHGGWLDLDAAHLHPLNLALGLAHAASIAGVRIFEDSTVTAYHVGGATGRTPHGVETATRGKVRCRHLVLACNGYLDGLEPRLMRHIMPIDNYMLATEPLGEERARALIRDDVAVADSRFVVNYFRLSSDRRLLFGGGETYSPQPPKDPKAFVRRRMLDIYPQLADVAIDYAWGGTLGITLSRLPHVGRLAPDVYFAQGYSGHGVALASLAGQTIAEAVAGTAERFDVFARIPERAFPGGERLRRPLQVLGMLYYSLRDRL